MDADLDPHILQLEPPEQRHQLLGCCCDWPLQKSARLVAYLSLLSTLSNAVSLAFAEHRFLLHSALEVGLVLVELYSIAALFLGLARKKAALLKPYLVCGVSASASRTWLHPSPIANLP